MHMHNNVHAHVHVHVHAHVHVHVSVVHVHVVMGWSWVSLTLNPPVSPLRTPSTGGCATTKEATRQLAFWVPTVCAYGLRRLVGGGRRRLCRRRGLRLRRHLRSPQAAAAAAGTVDARRATGSSSAEYLRQLSMSQRSNGVFINDPKGLFILRWCTVR